MGGLSKDIALAMVFYIVIPLAMGFSVSVNTGSSDRSIGFSTEYRLDLSTALQDRDDIDGENIIQIREAYGTGSNLIEQSVTGNDYKTKNLLDSAGSFSVSSTVISWHNGAELSQSLKGCGDLSSVLQASTGMDVSAQEIEMTGGLLSTSQRLVAADGAYTNQETEMSGESGAIAATSSSLENEVSLSAGFLGSGGSINADLSSIAMHSSAINGEASLLGIEVLGNDQAALASSTDTAMTVDGLYEKPAGDLGTFGFSMTSSNKKMADSDKSALLSGPEYSSNDGDINAYALKIYRLSKDSAPMQIVVKDDAALQEEGLTASNVANAILLSANTWGSATNKKLFADSNTVVLSATAKSDTRDNMRVHAFKPSTSSCIAFARTWFSSTKEDGYYKILETDITYNSKYAFSMDGSNGYDFQSIALHELGHSLGLGDLYYSNRAGQVMNGYYHGVDRDLGNGDKTGIWKLYG